MRWGRRKKQSAAISNTLQNSGISRAANAVMIAGTILCTLFFCTAAQTNEQVLYEYPAGKSQEALIALTNDHTTLASVLGINAYFPEEAVLTGSFSNDIDILYQENAHKKWTFSDYLRDAFRILLGGEAD